MSTEDTTAQLREQIANCPRCHAMVRPEHMDDHLSWHNFLHRDFAYKPEGGNWCFLSPGHTVHQQRADPVHVQQSAEVSASVTLPANTIKVGDRIDFKQPAEPCDDGCCKNSPCDFEPSDGAGSPSTPTPAHDRDHEYRLCADEDHSRGCGCCNECGGHEAQHDPHAYETSGDGCYVCDLDEDHGIHVQREERAERGDGGRDPHCALPHPHGRSSRCAGD